jgi:hypothetical protein
VAPTGDGRRGEEEEEEDGDEEDKPQGKPGLPFLPPVATRPPAPSSNGRARMAAEPSAGARDGVTGAIPTTPAPDNPTLRPNYTGLDRWTMAELWARGVPEEYARLLRAPVMPALGVPSGRTDGEVVTSQPLLPWDGDDDEGIALRQRRRRMDRAEQHADPNWLSARARRAFSSPRPT